MDADTLKALHGSIAKWEAIVAGTGEDLGTLNCPLCQLLYDTVGHDDDGNYIDCCFACPVYKHTERTGCEGTPYPQYDLDANPEAAQLEVDFLRSLLPKEPTDAQS